MRGLALYAIYNDQRCFLDPHIPYLHVLGWQLTHVHVSPSESAVLQKLGQKQLRKTILRTTTCKDTVGPLSGFPVPTFSDKKCVVTRGAVASSDESVAGRVQTKLR